MTKRCRLAVEKEEEFLVTPSMEYLGHRIDQDDRHPTDEKIRVIKGVPSPTNITELC